MEVLGCGHRRVYVNAQNGSPKNQVNNTLAGAYLGLIIMLTQQIHSTLSLSLSVKPHPPLKKVIRNNTLNE